MTNTQDNKNKKRLTLGGSKLTLGTKSLPQNNKPNAQNSSEKLIIDVTHGKAVIKTRLPSNNTNNEQSDNNHSQANRRLAALAKAKDNTNNHDIHINTLSELAEINQESALGNIGTTEKMNTNDSDSKAINNSLSPRDTQETEGTTSNTEANKEKQTNDISPTDTNSPQTDTESTNGNTANITHATDKENTTDADAANATKTKPKNTEPKKLKKSDIIHMLDEDATNAPSKTRSLASIKRARIKHKRKNDALVKSKIDKVYREVIIPETITVTELSNRMTERASEVVRELMKLGIMATNTQSIDADTAEIIVTSFGHSVKRVQASDIENILIHTADTPHELVPRAPVVTVMGHVDHGKTSLLDALKSTNVVTQEAGGITQHIGAYNVTMANGAMITFIDTPGHEAFTTMRTRGTQITDIVVLVVAADDGIKTQTIEAINHAKAANVPIIVAINKIDKPGADITKVKNELLLHELITEDLGGDIIAVEISALHKTNLQQLEEAILLVAEMQELKANPNAAASAVVIESRITKNQGVVTTIIVQNGSVKKGDLIIAGTKYGKIKRICNDRGHIIDKAGPSAAVEISGFNDAPASGDILNAVQNEKQARDITEYRERKIKNMYIDTMHMDLDELFLRSSGDSIIKELPLIIKGDVTGSVEAIIASISKINSDEVKTKILHHGVGDITESDIGLAQASGAMILGFNVKLSTSIHNDFDENNKTEIRCYSIIYDLLNDLKSMISGMLSPIIHEKYIGSAVIREVFNITKVGIIAGSYITKGIVKRNALIKLSRDNNIIYKGTLKTLKRFKDDAKEVREGFECGIGFDNYDDIKVNDLVEVFEIVEEKKQL